MIVRGVDQTKKTRHGSTSSFQPVAIRLIANALAFCLMWQPALASAAVVVDRHGPAANQAVLDQAANGVGIVHIVPPTAKGVSHNKFNQLDIEQQGLIFNNSRQTVKTQLGGYIDGNTHLKKATARIILNEVTGTNRSQLDGYAEVAGRSAEFVIANPNGITCQGCGFINTPRAILTTGIPQMQEGELACFDVNDGDLTINGLSADNLDRVDLLSRAIEINDAIHAKQLHMVTGRNVIDYADLSLRKKADDGSVKPRFALDAKALGALYANRIFLVGTEAGVGVRSASDMSASAIRIDSDGTLQVKKAIAQEELQFNTQQDIVITESAYGKTAQLTALGTIDNQDLLAAEQTVRLEAGHITNRGDLIAGLDRDGTLNRQGRLTLAARHQITNKGELRSSGTLHINTAQLDNQAALIAGKQVTVNATAGLENQQGEIDSQETLTLTTGDLDNSSGTIDSNAELTVDAASLDNSSGTITAAGSGDSRLTISGAIDNDHGTLQANGANLQIRGSTLSNQGGDILHAGNGAATLTLQTLDNSASGQIQAQSDLILNIPDFAAGDGTLNAGDQLILNTTGDITTATGSRWLADNHLQINTDGALNHYGELSTGGNLGFSGTNLTNHAGAVLSAGHNLNLALAGDILNELGARLSAANNLTLTAVNLDNQGIIAAGNDLTATLSHNLTNSNTLFAGNNAHLYAVNQLHNTRGANIFAINDITIAANSDLDKNAAILNESATIEAYGGDIHLATHDLQNRDALPSITLTPVTTIRQEVFRPLLHPGMFYGNPALPKNQGYPILQEKYPEALNIFENHTPNYAQKYFWENDSGNRITRFVVNVTVQEEQADLSRRQAASLIAGNNLTINAKATTNQLSQIAANGDIHILGDTLTNASVALHELTRGSWLVGRKKKDDSKRYLQYDGKIDDSRTLSHLYSTITAGGAFLGDFTGQVDNVSIRSNVPDAVTSTLRNADTTANAKELNGVTAATYNPVDHLTLPQQGLFVVNRNPVSRYLVETNPAFTDYARFLSSDYLLERLNYDPDQLTKRLGDGFYENRLIRDAIFHTTGKRYLAGQHNDEEQYRHLMENAIDARQRLNLSLGIALTPDQAAQLTQDIVWLVEQEVQGQRVLAPVYYASALKTDDLRSNGALLHAQQLVLNAGTIHNSGTISARDNLHITAAVNLKNLGGAITSHSSTGRMALVARDGNLLNTGGRITAGGDLHAVAGRDIKLQTRTIELRNGSGRNRQESVQHIGSSMTAGGNLQLQSGRGISIQGGKVKAGGNVALDAGRDLELAAVANTQYNENYRKSGRRKTHRIYSSVTHVGTTVDAGGDINATAGRDLTLTGSKATASGDIALNALRDLAIKAVNDKTYSYLKTRKKRSFGRRKSTLEEERVSSNVGSAVTAGGHLTLNSRVNESNQIELTPGRKVDIVGSHLTAGKDLVVNAQEHLTLDAGEESYHYLKKKKKSGFAGLSKSSSKHQQDRLTTLGASLNAQRDVVLLSGTDTNVLASHVAADENIQINAGRSGEGDINILSKQNSDYQFHEEKKSNVGLSFSSKSVSIASKTTKGTSNTQTTNVAGRLNAGKNVTLGASRDINLVGSQVSANDDIRLDAGRDVNLLAAAERQDDKRWESESKIGISWNSDDNGINFFAGKEATKTEIEEKAHLSAGSQLNAGRDVVTIAGRDINQLGGEAGAGRDITYLAKRNLTLAADSDTLTRQETFEQSQSGLGIRIQHNYGKTKEAIKNTGQGDNAISKASSVHNTVDSVSQALAGPQVSSSLGHSQTRSHVMQTQGFAQGSRLKADRDIALIAGKQATLEGVRANAGRDIVLTGEKTTVQSAQNTYARQSEQTQSWTGIRQQGRSAGLGASLGADTVNVNTDSAAASNLTAHRDVAVTATDDIRIAGSDIDAGRDLHLNAGDQVTITTGQGNYREKHDGWNAGGEVGVTVFENGSTLGYYVEVSGGQNDLQRTETSHRNSHLNAGSQLNLDSQGDTTIAGATIGADQLNINVAGNLTIASLQDTGKAEGKRWDGKVRVTVGAGASVSGSAGYGETDGQKAWVAEQTRLTGRKSVTINTKHHTQLDGALIANIQEDGTDGGNLQLTTGTFGYRNLHDKHTEKSHYTHLSGSWSSEGASQNQGPDSDYTQTTGRHRGEETGSDLDSRTTWGIEGSYSNLDRKQINRATVGDGSIVVTADQQTGQDSTKGLNRDIHLAQVVTRDKESNTDLYLTESAIEDTVGLFKEDDPTTPKNEDTLDRWATLVKDYGKNTTRQFIQMGKVAKAMSNSDNVAAQLMGAITQGMNDTLDALGTLTLGVVPVPGVKNHGGLVAQLPALVFGDQLNNVVEITLKITEDGRYEIDKYYVAGEDINIENLPEDIRYAFVNGIQNSLEEAARNGAMQTGTDRLLVAYNPEHGFLADIIETGWDKTLGAIFPSGNSRQVGEMWRYFSENNIPMKGAGHSQGGLLTMRGLQWLGKGTIKVEKDDYNRPNYMFQINGSPVKTDDFAKTVYSAIGYRDKDVFNPDPATGDHNINPGDFVPLVLGRNAKNMKESLDAMFNVLKLFGENSPHSNYFCTGDFCDNKQPGIGGNP